MTDACAGCGRPMLRTRKPVPAGFVQHHSAGRCRTCEVVSRRERGVYKRETYQPKPAKVKRLLSAAPLLQYVETLGLKQNHDGIWAIVRRARTTGEISYRAADRVAVLLLGVHPSAIWGEAWFDCEEEVA